MIAIMGANGNIGGAALRALEKTQQVRAVVRRPLQTSGATAAMADYRDIDQLACAFEGAGSVLVVLPLDPTAADVAKSLCELCRGVTEALLRSRPDRVVMISDYGAHHPHIGGIPALFGEFERMLSGQSWRLTVLRSAEHLQNWTRSLPAAKQGMLPWFYPADDPRPFVCAREVGRYAARCLLQSPEAAVLHAEGPTRLDQRDVARTFANVLSKEVSPALLPPPAWPGAFEGAGIPEGYSGLLQTTFQAHALGLIEAENEGQVWRGKTTLREVLEAI